MVSNNKQQINTFTGGMDLDTADQDLTDKKYREAFNLRVVTDANGTSGSLSNIEGVRFYQSIMTNLPTGYVDPIVVQVNSVRKYGVILVKATKSSDSKVYYFIFRFVNKDSLIEGEDATPKLIFGPCPTSLGDNPSTVTRWEDEDNIKLYYADGEQPLRVINIAPAVDGTRIMTDDGSMSIYPTATLTQPEFLSFGSGNLMTGAYQYGYQLFTRNGSETEVSPLTNMIQVSSNDETVSPGRGSAKEDRTNKSVRLRVPIADQNYNMIRIISVFYESVTETPLIQVLREMQLSGQTEISIQLVNNDGLAEITPEEFNMITSVHFAPKIIETKNNYLFASDIQYRDQIFDVEYDSRAYSGILISGSTSDTTAILKSNSGDAELSVSLNSIASGTTIVGSTHDAINPFTDLTKQYTSFSNTYSSGMDTTNAKCAFMYDGSNGLIWGGKGKNIKWRFVVTELEERSGDPWYSSHRYYPYGSNDNQVAEARPFEGVWVANVNSAGDYVNKKFRRLSDTQITIPCNYANQIIRSNCTSLHRDEVYRYGIVMYDKFRNQAPVKWVADIRTPAAYETGFKTFIANSFTSFLADGTGKRSILKTLPLGIEFEVNNLPEDVVSYEIVRVRRTESDRATITQGVVSKLSDPSVSGNVGGAYGPVLSSHRFPMPFMFNGHGYVDIRWDEEYGRTTGSLLTMSSPEVCYNYTGLESAVPSSGIRAEVISYLFSATSRSGSVSNAVIASFNESFYNSDGYLDTHTPTGTGTAYEYPSRIFRFNSSLMGVHDSQVSDGSSQAYVARTYNMYEQSTLAEYVSSIAESDLPGADPGYKVYPGRSRDVNKVLFPKETSWSNHTDKLDYVSSLLDEESGTAYSYVPWAAVRYGRSGSINNVMGLQGPSGRKIAFSSTVVPGPSSRLFNWFQLMAASRVVDTSTSALSGHTTSTASYTGTDYADNGYFPESALGTPLCNLRKSVVPYGGNDYQSRQFSSYIGQQAHRLRNTSTQYVFSGDTFIGVLRYVNLHYFPVPDSSDTGSKDGPHYLRTSTFFYNIPCESSINVALQNGQAINEYIQIQPSNVNGRLIQTVPAYVFNTAFTVESTVRLFTPEQALDEYNKHIDIRTHYSLKKSNDESVDSWTKFKPLNYLDVDSQYGSINNLRTFHTQLVFMQNNAVGVFQVEDRSLIQDQSNSSLLLGTSGVMDRYDYIHTKNGMKQGHHDTDAQSDSTLYFYDYDKRELCAYAQNQVMSLGKTFNVQSYIERIGATGALQSPSPLLSYDKKYNECFATISGTESLIFNERINAFSGFYTLTPTFRLYFDGDVYFVKDNNLYKYNDNMVNNGFDDVALPIRLNYLVNTDFANTKVFDNIEFTGELVKDKIRFDFVSSYLSSNNLPGSDLSMREYNFRGAIPRVSSSDKFANRLRGRVLYCTMRYNQDNREGTSIVTIINEEFMQTIVDNDNIITNNVQPNKAGAVFELPYIRTTFRISKS